MSHVLNKSKDISFSYDILTEMNEMNDSKFGETIQVTKNTHFSSHRKSESIFEWVSDLQLVLLSTIHDDKQISALLICNFDSRHELKDPLKIQFIPW